ncbi:DUF1349 domain-containing protein [Candidatus Enterococcus clewellii]|uniref:DUF1349 domain-containing protein n=1 Tax=Candidatus Enterococcus clewellii TaxID=1834193 RepID=A0A242KBY2_9ENTE|nr:DUF1349 domain-containing protein [Enterococcus sp. 9E7_DIV0242]OTP18579.1 hypothetical protein A5888_000393 [Enterococcus sp. 9E7_DIV0242]
MTIIDKRLFDWLTESSCVVKENELQMEATKKSDYFIHPETGESSLNAPFLYTTISGDFTIRAKVTPQFKEIYDACGLLIYDRASLWGKLCFEYTDMGVNAVVSVITDKASDDANGQSLVSDNVWLQISRKGQLFSMHYSLDGKVFRMVRYFSLPCNEEIKVGFLAQSPLGDGGSPLFQNIFLVNEPLTDMRRGE